MFLIIFLSFQYAIFYGQNNFVTATFIQRYNEGDSQNIYPFIVSINIKDATKFIKDNHVCGGSLISERHVLTAAHCIENEVEEDIEIIANTSDLSSRNYKIFNVKCWLTYRSWSYKNVNPHVHDLAVITLDTVNTNILPVIYLSSAKAKKFKKIHNLPVVLPGWGVSKTHRTIPAKMQKINLIAISKDDCRKKIKLINPGSKNMIKREALLCTIPFSDSTVATCGYSGSPILDENNYLIGVHLGICRTRQENLSIFSRPIEVQIEADIGYYNDFILYAMQYC